jgi:MFS superfamily sulfate permease-like transporter
MNQSGILQSLEQTRVVIASSLAFYTAIFQLALTLAHLGVLSKYLSDTIVLAFTTGAAYHVIFSEISCLFGIKVNISSFNFFKIVRVSFGGG